MMNIRARLESMRRRGTRDRGVIMMSTLILLVLISGTIYAMVSTTGRSIKSAGLTKDFAQAGQLADQAVQEAIYQLNERPSATRPTADSRAYSTKDNDGDGKKDWNWHMGPITATGLKSTVIYAEGTFRGTTRKVQVSAGALLVGGFSSTADDQLTYELSPETAFNHVVLGRNITLQNGIGVAPSEAFVSGNIGLLKGAPVMAPAPGTTAKNDARYRLYGSEAAEIIIGASSKVPAGLKMDTKFVDENIKRCGGATPAPWVASQNGGLLVANGNVGCYSIMNFDIPTSIVGSGAFNAFVSGNITVGANISGASSAGLNIYTNGESIDFRTEDAPGTSLSVKNTFIYAPGATCKTIVNSDPAKFRSASKGLTFTGSLACDTVMMAGQFTGVLPIGPLGGDSRNIRADDPYRSEVWFLVDYQQPGGTRS